jgi:pantothenate kinase-related protein Tda10
MLKIDGPTTIKKVLMFTSFMSNWGMCIFQGWILGFDPNSPKGMEIPTWVILRKFII